MKHERKIEEDDDDDEDAIDNENAKVNENGKRMKTRKKKKKTDPSYKGKKNSANDENIDKVSKTFVDTFDTQHRLPDTPANEIGRNAIFDIKTRLTPILLLSGDCQKQKMIEYYDQLKNNANLKDCIQSLQNCIHMVTTSTSSELTINSILSMIDKMDNIDLKETISIELVKNIAYFVRFIEIGTKIEIHLQTSYKTMITRLYNLYLEQNGKNDNDNGKNEIDDDNTEDDNENSNDNSEPLLTFKQMYNKLYPFLQWVKFIYVWIKIAVESKHPRSKHAKSGYPDIPTVPRLTKYFSTLSDEEQEKWCSVAYLRNKHQILNKSNVKEKANRNIKEMFENEKKNNEIIKKKKEKEKECNVNGIFVDDASESDCDYNGNGNENENVNVNSNEICTGSTNDTINNENLVDSQDEEEEDDDIDINMIMM